MPRRIGSERLDYSINRSKLTDYCTELTNSCFDSPLAVFGVLDQQSKTTFQGSDACFACGALVKQCPEWALRMS